MAAPSEAPSPFAVEKGGLRVAVRLTPKAARTGVKGMQPLADGRMALKVTVTAAPEAGKANAALIKLLAKEWRIPGSSLEIAKGRAERQKTILIRGAGEALLPRLNAWMEKHHG
jgi:uncharacterized protein (TIGR00251 family)